MDSRSKYKELKYVVECEPPPNPATWFRPICAFDSDSVALDYADRCRQGNTEAKGWRYRVMMRKGARWIEIKTRC